LRNDNRPPKRFFFRGVKCLIKYQGVIRKSDLPDAMVDREPGTMDKVVLVKLTTASYEVSLERFSDYGFTPNEKK
jgi:hypothetical protein